MCVYVCVRMFLRTNGSRSVGLVRLFDATTCDSMFIHAWLVLAALVKLGDEHHTEAVIPSSMASAATKVHGCTSNVYVAVSATDTTVNICGEGKGHAHRFKNICYLAHADRWYICEADSRIARGLLVLLRQGFRHSSPSEVLRISASRIAEACMLPTVMPPSRMSGFANILQVRNAFMHTEAT
jgi:sulfur transfer protein SufE